MRRIVLTIIAACWICIAHATDSNTLQRLIDDLKMIGGKPSVIEQTEKYTRIQLTDSATMELYEADNYIVVLTVCAPICSSCARVYNNVGEFLFPLEPPIKSIFPLATIDPSSGRIVWTDNDKWEY